MEESIEEELGFVCQGCGERLESEVTKHTYGDCLRYKEEIGKAPNIVLTLEKMFVRLPLNKDNLDLTIQILQLIRKDIYEK